MSAWWKALSLREQRLVLGGGAALLIAILYWGLWQPLADRADAAERQVQTERQLLNWVHKRADEITALRKSVGQTGAVSSKGLNQVVNETTRQFSIEIIRMQPRDEAVQVWVKPLSFNTLTNWLAFLQQQHGVETQFIDINRTETAGVIEVNRLQLGRGGE